MSNLTVKYFGVIAEVTDKMEEEILIQNDSIPMKELIATCLKKYPGLGNVSFKIAHNQKIIESGEVNAGDEIALLPPFSGG